MRIVRVDVTKPLFNRDIEYFSFSIKILTKKCPFNTECSIDNLYIDDIIFLNKAINRYLNSLVRPTNSYLSVGINCISPEGMVEYEIRQIAEASYLLIVADAPLSTGSLNGLSEDEVIELSEMLTQIINVYEQGGEL